VPLRIGLTKPGPSFTTPWPALVAAPDRTGEQRKPDDEPDDKKDGKEERKEAISMPKKARKDERKDHGKKDKREKREI
jgi:hypothetical protein